MNGRGDIDGILEGWFLDGPTQMPDRLFDAVLDQVERVPQRRLARLQLRFSDMSTSSRLLAAGAAAVLVIGIGVVALGRVNEQGPGSPSPSPSPSESPASSAAGAVPSVLQYPMLGPVRSEPPAPANQVQSAITFTGDRFDYNQSLLRSEASEPSPGQIRLVSDSIAGGCASGDEGIYDWSTTPLGSIATFTLVSDECQARAAVVPGEWQRSACENADNLCLGPLDAGEYASQFVDPFVHDPDDWAARFGAITYEVPAGWANTADFPGFYNLGRTADPPDSGVWMVADVVAINSADPCVDDPEPGAGRTAEELTTFLTTLPGVIATTPEAVTVGGLSGYRFDLRMDPAWTATCPFSGGEPTRPILTDSSGGQFHWALGPTTMERNYLLDSGGGWALLIDIEAQGDDAFNALVEEADTVVNSMVFTP